MSDMRVSGAGGTRRLFHGYSMGFVHRKTRHPIVSMAGLVTGSAQGQQVGIRVGPREQQTTTARIDMILAMVDMQLVAGSAMAASVAIALEDALPQGTPLRMTHKAGITLPATNPTLGCRCMYRDRVSVHNKGVYAFHWTKEHTMGAFIMHRSPKRFFY
jgi:hypothetical protein